MRKGRSWRPKTFRVTTLFADKGGTQVSFLRAPGMAVTVRVPAEGDCTVYVTPGLKGLPMPQEREQGFIDAALGAAAELALVGHVGEREVEL